MEPVMVPLPRQAKYEEEQEHMKDQKDPPCLK